MSHRLRPYLYLKANNNLKNKPMESRLILMQK